MFSSVLPHILSVFSVKGKIRENSLSVLGRLFLLKAVSIPPTVVDALKKHKISQSIDRLKAGEAWEASGFVFTNELGHHVSPNTVYHNFKRIAASIGLPEARLHDLRHSYATEMMRSGASIKSIQDTLGHHSSAFTTDTYIGVTDELKKDAAEKMEGIIQKASGK